MVNHASLNIVDTIKTAWGQVKGSKGSFWMVFLFIFVTRLIYQGLHSLEKIVAHTHSHPFILLLLTVLACITILFEFMLILGAVYLGVQRAANLDIRYTMIKNVLTWKIFLTIIGYALLTMLLFIPAIILILIPDVLSYTNFHLEFHIVSKLINAVCYVLAFIYIISILLRLYLGKVFIAVEKLNPWLAVKRSFQATRYNTWKLLGLIIINIIIFLISVIPFGIGLIWSLPYLYINYGVVYRRLALSTSKG